MRRKLISTILAVWVLLIVAMPVFAQNVDLGRSGAISVTLLDQDGETPITGAELSLYYVATVSLNSENHLSYSFTEAFKDCGCLLDDPALSGKLDAFVANDFAAAQKLTTDDSGKVSFEDLPLGLYFVKQTNAVDGYAPCTSFLVTVPNYTEEGYVYDVNASPKTDVVRSTTITIKKEWNTDASTKAADSVTVELLRDEVVVETALLSDQNNWQEIYEDMPESDGYSIREVNIPHGFTATYRQSGYVFTVTNTASLIQTGQTLWPIPVLAFAGIILIAAGSVLLQKKRKQDA